MIQRERSDMKGAEWKNLRERTAEKINGGR